MKKTDKKLSVQSETIKRMTSDELDSVAGGNKQGTADTRCTYRATGCNVSDSGMLSCDACAPTQANCDEA